jgi:hypothetical protein
MQIRLSLLPVLVLTLVGLSSCSWLNRSTTPANPEPTPTPEVSISGTADTLAKTGTVLIGTDEKSEIDLPDGWASDRELHEEAQIQASNRTKRMYVIVLSEDKSAFPQPLTLAKHSEITRSILLENLTNPKVTELPTVKKVGNFPALQYEIQGKINDIEVTYLHTTVETPTRFSQILAWTTPTSFKTDKPELEQVVSSFRERPTTTPSPISPGGAASPTPSVSPLPTTGS